MLLGWLETLQQATQSMSICDEIFKGWKTYEVGGIKPNSTHTQYVYWTFRIVCTLLPIPTQEHEIFNNLQQSKLRG